MTSFKDTVPDIDRRAKVFDGARLVGDVTVGAHCGIWYNVVIRGDMAPVKIGARTNVQDGAIIHTDANQPTIIGEDVTIGHGAIIHAARVERGALIGMGSIVLNGAIVGEEALVAAGALVPPGKRVPPRTLVVGNPMRVVKELGENDIEDIRKNKDFYVRLLEDYA